MVPQTLLNSSRSAKSGVSEDKSHYRLTPKLKYPASKKSPSQERQSTQEKLQNGVEMIAHQKGFEKPKSIRN